MYSQNQIQNIERRSIALYRTDEGVRSLPVFVDRKVFAKTSDERKELKKAQNGFKYDGLHAWNERNRPGNNKKFDKSLKRAA